MTRASWTCACRAVNRWTAKFCEGCGVERAVRTVLTSAPLSIDPPAPPRLREELTPEIRALIEATKAKLARAGPALHADSRADRRFATPGERETYLRDFWRPAMAKWQAQRHSPRREP